MTQAPATVDQPQAAAPPDDAIVREASRLNVRWLLALVVATVWSYWPTLVELAETWEREPDYSHGYLVLPLFAFFLYLRRDLFPTVLRPSWIGLIVILASMGLRFIGGWYFLTPLDGWSIVLWTAGAAPEGDPPAGSIKIAGSDTMVNLAQKWAEVYMSKYSQVKLEVSGGGSGVGLAGLQKGTTQLANASRDIKQKEIDAIKEKFDSDVSEFVVALDALAVYVHPSNPLTEISMEDLKAIYGEGGTTENWEQVSNWPAEVVEPAGSGTN